MHRIAHMTPRLAVLYDGAAGPQVYRIAVGIAANAWDSGSSVRVRRLGRLAAPSASASHPDASEPPDDAGEIADVAAEDLEWASVTLVVRRPLSDLPGERRHGSGAIVNHNSNSTR